MTVRLYIDPGVHHLACAHFHDLRLLSVSFIPREAFLAGAAGGVTLFEVVIEKPQIYEGSNDEKDPNDCVDVAMAAAFAEAAIRARGGPPAQYVLPRDWKGQLKKPHHHERIWSVLDAGEKDAFARDSGHMVEEISAKIDRACELLVHSKKVKEYKWKAHNLLDAVGLGLWHLGRTGRAGHRFVC